MSNQQFVTFIQSKYNEVSKELLDILWELYKQYWRDGENVLNDICELFNYYQNLDIKKMDNFYKVMKMVRERVNSLRDDVFDAYNLETFTGMICNDYLVHIVDFSFDDEQIKCMNKYIEVLCKNKYNHHEETNVQTYLAYDLAIFPFADNLSLYQENLNISMKIYKFFEKHLSKFSEGLYQDNILDLIILSYIVLDDPYLSYQERLNYVIGSSQKMPDSIQEMSEFLVDTYKDPKIPVKYKNYYFIKGYLEIIDFYVDDYDIKDDLIKAGYDYYTDDGNEDKIETIVQNVTDYLNDDYKPKKHALFLTGIIIHGAQVYEDTINSKVLTLEKEVSIIN